MAIDHSTLNALKLEIRHKQEEIRKAEELIPLWKQDVQALQQAIDILCKQGSHPRTVVSQATIPFESTGSTKLNGTTKKTHEQWAIEVLGKANRPLTVDELAKAIQVNGCQSTKHSILGGVYRAAKKADSRIRLVESGVFELQRENAPSGSS